MTDLLFLECRDDTLRHRLRHRSEQQQHEQQKQRSDDQEEIIEARISTYHRETVPVIQSWYEESRKEIPPNDTIYESHWKRKKHLYSIDGEPDIVTVYGQVRQAFLTFLQHRERQEHPSSNQR